MKETFILRTEWYESIKELSDIEQANILKNLFEYHMGNTENITTSTLQVKLIWKLIEPNLKRNITAYDKRSETSALNGALGGRPPKNEKPNKPNRKPNKPIKSLSVSDIVSDTDIVSDIENDIKYLFEDFWSVYPIKVGKQKCITKFQSLTESEKLEIKTTLPKFIKYKPFEKYTHPNPETYLNQKRWQDEIPEIKQIVKKQSLTEQHPELNQW